VRPCCLNCTNTNRICSYTNLIRGQRASQPVQFELARATASRTSRAPTPSPAPAPALAPTRILTPPIPAYSGVQMQLLPGAERSIPRPQPDTLVNITHLELFNHVVQGTFLFLDRDDASTDKLKKTAVSIGFSFPYLMHGILAFSAWHLSTQADPEKSRLYLGQSTVLQTWAVASFKSLEPGSSREACLASFLFSILLATHALADLTMSDTKPELYLVRFGQYVELHRGALAIMHDCWTVLQQTEEAQPILQAWESSRLACTGTGPECDKIRQLVKSAHLSAVATQACYEGIEQLQYVFNECRSQASAPTHCVYGMCFLRQPPFWGAFPGSHLDTAFRSPPSR
jgi:hypothetical protein